MREEKTPSRVFDGGGDPSTVKLDDADEVRARKKFVKTGRDHTIIDLGIRLERDLVERLDPQLLKTGEEQHRLRLCPKQADWVDMMYIRAEPTDENEKFDHVVRQSDDYPTLGMSRAWLRNEVVNGIPNPFHNADPDDYVVVRYLLEEAIEIYSEEVFTAHPQFTPVAASSV